MKVLVVAHYQSDGSPCAIFIHDQVKAYSALGHSVTVIVPLALGKMDYFGKRWKLIREVAIDGVNYIFIRHLSLSNYGKKSFNTRMALITVRKILRSGLAGYEPDIVQAHTFLFDSELGIFLKQRLDIPLVITTHGSDLDIPIRSGNTEKVKDEIIKADYVVAVSKKLERDVRGICPEGRVKTIWNGCNTDGCRVSGKKQRSILFVGSLIKQKNANIVIEALSELCKTHSDTRLVIVGRGPEKEALHSLCRQLQIENKVIFTGQISNDKVLEYMSESEYFVMPGVHEGFGIVYTEAMASGCLTIGTKNEGIADFIRDGENGFLTEPDSSEITEIILKCEKHPGIKARIRENAIRDAKALSWTFNAEENLRLFEEIINNESKDETK